MRSSDEIYVVEVRYDRDFHDVERAFENKDDADEYADERREDKATERVTVLGIPLYRR